MRRKLKIALLCLVLLTFAVLLRADSLGIHITSGATAAVARMFNFDNAMIGISHATDPTHVLGVYSDDEIQFVKYSSGIVWGWIMDDKTFYPAGNDYTVGIPSAPVNEIYGTTYYAGTANNTTQGATTTLTCGSGEAVKTLTVKGGIVTDAGCGTPLPAPVSDLAALRSLLAAQDARIAALEADLATLKAAAPGRR
jgi:hypothetical protein